MNDVSGLLKAMAVGYAGGAGADVSCAHARVSANAGMRCGCWAEAGQLGQVAEALERDSPHDWRLVSAISSDGASGDGLRAKRWLPPALNQEQQAELKAAVQAPPREAGIELANWNWKGVREYRRAALWPGTGAEQLSQLPASSGLRAEAAEEATLKADAEKRAEFVESLRQAASRGREGRAPRSSSSMRPTSEPMPT